MRPPPVGGGEREGGRAENETEGRSKEAHQITKTQHAISYTVLYRKTAPEMLPENKMDAIPKGKCE